MAAEIKYVEGDLTALSHATQYPPTPDLATGFWRSIEDGRREAAPASRWPLLWPAAAAVVVVGAVLIGTVAPVRDAAAGLFDRINIFSTNEPIEGLPDGMAGEDTTVETAAAALGRSIEQPAYPEGLLLERALLQDFGVVKAAVLYYRAPGLPPFEMFVTDAYIGKGIAADSGVSAEPVEWPGTSGAYWFAGPHRVEYRDFDGAVIENSVRRTNGNTLVWERGGFVYRLEGELERGEAIRIARSLSVSGD